MDVWNNTSIDLGLQIVGYLAAVGLGMILQSFFRQSRKVTVAAANRPVITEARPTVNSRLDDSSVEFISLSRSSSKAAVAKSAVPTTGRRNRAEVLDLARKMIRAGAAEDIIRRTVPVSEGELAMLRHEQSL